MPVQVLLYGSLPWSGAATLALFLLAPFFSTASDVTCVSAVVRALLTYLCPVCDLLAVFALQ